MALRFRRTFRLAPGLRLNVSKGGASLSAGPRGASMTFGRRGTFFNAGIPGTGLSSRQAVGIPSAPRRDSEDPRKVSIRASVSVEEDGTVKFLDAEGRPLSPEWVARAKRQMGDAIRNLIQDSCDKINAKVDALGTIHVQTPAPNERLRYEPQEFRPAPDKPSMRPHGFLSRLFRRVRSGIDAENAKRLSQYENVLTAWRAEKTAFDEAERGKRRLLEELVFSEVAAMEEVLEGALQSIEWPRETTVSAEINDGGRVVLLDVDLPELEDMPKTTASVPSKGYKLTVKEMSATKIQKLYMEHVHGIGFRIMGEAFAVLPNAQEVILSAFSQRPNKATGAVSDEYLYSVRAKRIDWEAINFGNLEALDVVSALERFQLRRDVTKAGLFRPIEPLTASVQQADQHLID